MTLPTRGIRSPYTGGALSLHGGFDLPTRYKRLSLRGCAGEIIPVEDVPAVGTVVTFAWKGKTIDATVAA